MVSSKLAILAAGAASLATVVNATYANNTVSITVSKTGGNATSGHQYGFLHEDINYSGDGGFYAELIRNRAFQYSPLYPVSLDHWFPLNGAVLSLNELSEPLSSALPYSMNVKASSKAGLIGFENDGYFGMSVTVKQYTGSFYVKGAYNGNFIASLRSNTTGEVYGQTTVLSKAVASEWVQHTFTLVPFKAAPDVNNTFAIEFQSSGVKGGSLDFNLISLFPPTYKGRQNGLRQDLAETLADYGPSLMRFPGGNMLEGETIPTFYNWSNSVGPLKDRPGYQGVWGYEQDNGLGIMEYFYWCEDMGLEPVLAVYSGLSLDGSYVAEADLQPYIDLALNEIEFVTGDTSTTYGALRANYGREEPFHLRYVEVGNEEWLAGGTAGFESYQSYRFPMFFAAIQAKYPDIQVITGCAVTDGYDIPEGAWGDYHIYDTPDRLVSYFGLFDHQETPHIVGEMACVHPNGGTDWDGPLMPHPFWIGAVSEGVDMLGYERNCDRVKVAAYAPIINSLDSSDWPVTMIQFSQNPALTTKSVDWYVWHLYATNAMTNTLPSTSNFNPVYYVAGADNSTGARIWKGAVYNTTNSEDLPIQITFEGVPRGTLATLTVLSGPAGDPYAYNDPYTGVNVVSTTEKTLVADRNGAYSFTLPELSVAVLKTNSVGSLAEKRGLRWGERVA